MLKRVLLFCVLLFSFSFIHEVSASLNGCSDPNLITDKDCVEIYSCDVLDNPITYYLLMNDVNSDNSCRGRYFSN